MSAFMEAKESKVAERVAPKAQASLNDNEAVPVELEHVIGYSGAGRATLVTHPVQKNIIVYSIGSVVCISDITDPHKQQFLRGHDGDVSTIAIAASGVILASGQVGSAVAKQDTAKIIVWHVQTGKKVTTLRGISGGVNGLQFSPDGKFLAGTGENGVFLIWDVNTGDVVSSEKHPSPVTTVAWGKMWTEKNSRHPTYTLASSVAEKVRLHTLVFDAKAMSYVLQTRNCQLPARGFVRNYLVTVFDETSDFLFAGTDVGDVIVFGTSGAVFRTGIQISANGVRALATAGSLVYAGAGDGVIKKLSGRDNSWSEVSTTKLDGPISSLSFTADKHELISGTQRGRMYRISAQSLVFAEISESHTAPVNHIAFGPKPDLFCTIAENGQLFVWDLTDYIVKARISGPTAGTFCLINDNSIISGWKDGSIRSYALQTGQEQWCIPNAHRGAVTRLAAAKNYLISAGEDGALRLWAWRTQSMLSYVKVHNGPIRGLVVDIHNEDIVHSCGDDKTVVSFNTKTNSRIITHLIQDGSFTALTQKLDGDNELLAAEARGFISVWDVDIDQATARQVDPSRAKLNAIAVSPDGRFFAVAGVDHQVKLYEMASLQLIATCLGHSSAVQDIKWSPDQKQLVSVGQDGAVCIWNFYL